MENEQTLITVYWVGSTNEVQGTMNLSLPMRHFKEDEKPE